MISDFASELERFTGVKVRKLPSSSEIDKIGRRLQRIEAIQKQIEELTKCDHTPEVAAQMLSLINKRWRLILRGIPRGIEPIDYATEILHDMSKPPEIEGLPDEVNYQTKHLSLQQFINGLVQSTDEVKINDFIKQASTSPQLITQCQKSFNKVTFPKELQKLDARHTVKNIERLKLGLRSVTADWECWINLLYGLVELKNGEIPHWDKILKVSLRDKVEKILIEKQLMPLAKREWVTLRNSLDHGSAPYCSSKDTIEFKDTKKMISWEIHKVWVEGIDIHLSVIAANFTYNFILAKQCRKAEDTINMLKKLAQSTSAADEG